MGLDLPMLPLPGLTALDRARGCLVGGAVGDALGAPIEFQSLAEIRAQFGTQGVTGFEPAYEGRGSITDDTQMTFFTAEGLIRAIVRGRGKGVSTFPGVVHHAYLRWLNTQGTAWEEIRKSERAPDGWLIAQEVLHSRRGPGHTCLSALRGPMGARYKPINGSKACGGVMRMAPAGLLPPLYGEPFDLGCDLAAITHGHPSGFLSAGFLAMLVAELFKGAGLEQALDRTEPYLQRWPECGEVAEAVRYARGMARSKEATPENVEELGEGKVGEEALAIAIFCSLRARDFRTGVLSAVNHGGDCDSTGAITGNILGTLWGERSIPADWVRDVECREIAQTLATDLLEIAAGEGEVSPSQLERYPGW